MPPQISVEPDDTLYDRLGGRETLERVHKALYDKLYAHPWLKHFFQGKDQKHQENQQTEFMMRSMGGPKVFGGRLPRAAHEHLFITEEVFDLRHKILCETLDECGIPVELARRWAYIDWCFKEAVVKAGVDECRKRFTTDEIIVVEKPKGLKD